MSLACFASWGKCPLKQTMRGMNRVKRPRGIQFSVTAIKGPDKGLMDLGSELDAGAGSGGYGNGIAVYGRRVDARRDMFMYLPLSCCE